MSQDRVKILRQILEAIEVKCGTCPIVSTWYCNSGCLLPAAKTIAEFELKDLGEYIGGRRDGEFRNHD